MTYEELIDQLVQRGVLITPRIIEAFQTVKRADFMEEGTKNLAAVDRPAPIRWGQTISQPLTVALMLEWLKPEEGDIILDIGLGSGWTTTLLSKIVGEKGKVIAIEFFRALKEFGEKNAAKYIFTEGVAEFICGDGLKGWEEKAPYDKILVSAEAKELPPELQKQLKVGGRIVIPIGPSIWLFIKKNEIEFETKEYPGFAFVPLLSENERPNKEKVRAFLENPLHEEILFAIATLGLQGLPSSLEQIVNSVNLEAIKNTGKSVCSSKEAAEIISQLAELKLIKPTWMLGVSEEEIKDLLGITSEEIT